MATIDEPVRALLAAGRVGRLATNGPDGFPHVVPITYALDGDSLYSVIDEKPKRTPRLQRLRNLRADPRATLLVDRYDDRDWSRLAWVMLRVHTSFVDTEAERGRALELLRDRYPQYREMTLSGQVLRFDPVRVVSWSAG